MIRRLFPLLAIAFAGCSSAGTLPMATTAEKALPALESTLGAWKAGKKADELKAQSPPVYLLDADFSRGAKLVSFKIEDAGKPHGTGYRFDVTITVEAGGKPATPKKVAYRVVTEPSTGVSREDD